jgi:2-C-methyl-D-erythritol 4-phosphate cytidylyltransferase
MVGPPDMRRPSQAVHISAIVVAAGRGTRLGAPAAKAFVPLAGVPMAVYCLRTLSAVPGLGSTTLVVSAGFKAAAAAVLELYGPWPVPIRLTCGGAERQDSVAAGLAVTTPEANLVIVHDAARPFVSLACITSCIEAATACGAAIAAIPTRDTVKEVAPSFSITRTLDRQTIWLAQTPQVFRADLLRRAYEQAWHEGQVGTDDAALVERLGHTVRVVAGEATNLKITTPEDLRWAEWYATRDRTPG